MNHLVPYAFEKPTATCDEESVSGEDTSWSGSFHLVGRVIANGILGVAGGGQTPRIRILNDSNPTRFRTSPDVYVFSDCEHLLVFDYVRYRFDLIAAAIYRSIGKPGSLVGDQ